MEKLIDLLNEYEETKEVRDYTRRIGKQNKTRIYWTEHTWAYVDDEEAERIIISKKYWFIDWLIEEDKINLDRAYLETCCMCWWYIRYWEANGLVMQLSISSKPIEYLIFVLK